MNTIICEEPFRFVATETDAPSCGDGEVLVKIRRIGICGSDLHAFRGKQPYFTYPRILGHELSGEILKTGKNVTGLTPRENVVLLPYLECGTCVACRQGRTNCCARLEVFGVHRDGGMREIVAFPATHVVTSDTLSLDQLAMVEFHSIGAHAVRRAGIVQGETVLVVGAGPIGMGVVQFAVIAGARVLVMDINRDRLAVCKEYLGAAAIIDATNDPVAQVHALTDGDFPAVVFEATGNPQSMNASFGYTAHAGRLVFISIVQADITFSDPEFQKRELTLMSSRNATPEDFRHVMQCMEEGRIACDVLQTHRVPFGGMIDAFPSWLKPETGVIKALVDV